MNEKITDRDKLMHFGVCLALAIVHPCLAIGAALGKEYGDKNAQGNHWCWMDLLADAIGTLIGGAIHILIRIFVLHT